MNILKAMKPHKPKKNDRDKQKVQDALKDDSPYIAERKFDGCRYLTYDGKIVSPRKSRTTGKNVDKTDHVPHFHHLLSPELQNAIFDGEVCSTMGTSKSQDVVSIMGCNVGKAVSRQQEADKLHYVIFDILRLPNGLWLHDKPWSFRRAKLIQLRDKIETSHVHLSKVVTTNKEELLQQELDAGREGIVLKHQDRNYKFGKRPAWNWIKIKTEEEDDVVIMGFEPPTKEYEGKELEDWPHWENGQPVTRYYAKDWIGAIKFGKYNDEGELVQLGTCSGFTDEERRKFSENPDEYIGRVMKIHAMERTRDGAYRHPSFIMLHPDKNPRECKLALKEW